MGPLTVVVVPSSRRYGDPAYMRFFSKAEALSFLEKSFREQSIISKGQ